MQSGDVMVNSYKPVYVKAFVSLAIGSIFIINSFSQFGLYRWFIYNNWALDFIFSTFCISSDSCLVELSHRLNLLNRYSIPIFWSDNNKKLEYSSWKVTGKYP